MQDCRLGERTLSKNKPHQARCSLGQQSFLACRGDSTGAEAQGLSSGCCQAGGLALRCVSRGKVGEAHSCAHGAHFFPVRVALTNKCPGIQTIMFL